jgi:hypothetical protein
MKTTFWGTAPCSLVVVVVVVVVVVDGRTYRPDDGSSTHF